jgi:hypothetical protein
MQFTKAIRALCDAHVEFVVIDGASANLHGSAYVTFDLDLCYSRNSRNLRRLVGALAPYHPRPRNFPPELPFIWDVACLRNTAVLTLITDLGAIDLLAEVAGIGGWEQVKGRSVVVESFERIICTLDLKSLIQAKRAAGRPKDLAVLAELEGLLEANEP